MASLEAHNPHPRGRDAPNRDWAGVCSTPAQHCHTRPAACADDWDVVDVPHRTTSRISIKTWNWPLTWVRAAIEALTQALFAASDAAARQRGWHVTSTQCGFARVYRDPRFDTLASCPACCGHGADADGIECPPCHGTGRVVIKPDAQSSSDLPPGKLT
jgi:hypothetical protein